MDYLPDALAVLGLGLLATGVAMAWGLPFALMVVGIVLLLTGVVAAWKRG